MPLLLKISNKLAHYAKQGLPLFLVSICAYLVGELLTYRRVCSDVAYQITQSVYGGAFSSKCPDNCILSQEACRWLIDAEARRGSVQSYRILHVMEGPVGLPTEVSVLVVRRRIVYTEQLSMNGIGFVSEIFMSK